MTTNYFSKNIKSFLVTLGITTVLTGCSFNFSFSLGGLNVKKLEKTIQEELQTQIGISISSVNCPDNRKMEEGDEFECIAQGEKNSELIITVTQKDNSGNVKWNVTNSTNLLDMNLIENQIVESLEKKTGVSGIVNCGDDKFKVANAGTTFQCQGKSNKGQDVTIIVEVEDEQGNYKWNIK